MKHFYPKIPTGAQITTQRPTLKDLFEIHDDQYVWAHISHTTLIAYYVNTKILLNCHWFWYNLSITAFKAMICFIILVRIVTATTIGRNIVSPKLFCMKSKWKFTPKWLAAQLIALLVLTYTYFFFWLILYIPVDILVMSGRIFLGWASTKQHSRTQHSDSVGGEWCSN